MLWYFGKGGWNSAPASGEQEETDRGGLRYTPSCSGRWIAERFGFCIFSVKGSIKKAEELTLQPHRLHETTYNVALWPYILWIDGFGTRGISISIVTHALSVMWVSPAGKQAILFPWLMTLTAIFVVIVFCWLFVCFFCLSVFSQTGKATGWIVCSPFQSSCCIT